jgi:hypothetical protein
LKENRVNYEPKGKIFQNIGYQLLAYYSLFLSPYACFPAAIALPVTRALPLPIM